MLYREREKDRMMDKEIFKSIDWGNKKGLENNILISAQIDFVVNIFTFNILKFVRLKFFKKSS